MRLHLNEIIEYGGFGRVYLAKVISPSDPKVVAVKKQHITRHVRNSMTRHEAAAFLLLKGHPSTPEVYAWGRSQYWEYLALQLLGDTVANEVALDRLERATSTSVEVAPPPALTMRNLVAIVVQMLDALEHVHSRDIIHCDIKPGNFLFGIGPNAGRIYLVDYGLSRYYRDPVTKEHVVDKPMRDFLGTTCYSSIKIHFLHSPSRRDDLESLSYTIIRLLRGDVPWHEIYASQEACTVKQKWSGSDLCTGYPTVFGDFVEYTRSLEFYQTPDYAHWKDAFLEVVPELRRDACEYDASDTSQPLVGKSLSSTPNPTSSSFPLAPPSKSQYSDDSLPSSDDHWAPTSTWPGHVQIKDEDVFKDEARLVSEGVEHISEPPSMDCPSLFTWRIPETMETFDIGSPPLSDSSEDSLPKSLDDGLPQAHFTLPDETSESKVYQWTIQVDRDTEMLSGDVLVV